MLMTLSGEPARTFNVEMAMTNALNMLFDNDISKCIILITLKKDWFEKDTFKDVQKVQIDLNSTYNGEQFTKLLAKDSKCLANVVSSARVSTIISMTRPVGNYVSLLVDGKAPGKDVLLRMNRPLVMAKWGNIEVRSENIKLYISYAKKMTLVVDSK